MASRRRDGRQRIKPYRDTPGKTGSPARASGITTTPQREVPVEKMVMMRVMK
jgi:hypothetical protein